VKNLAPVLIFAYRRTDHLRNTLESLARCEGYKASPIIIYCDGPADEEDVAAVNETRQLLKQFFADEAEYHFSDENLGLSRSIITGVSNVVERFGRVIVLEDDLELSPSFLTFMNNALNKYENEEKVYQVSGYMYDVTELHKTDSALFVPLTVSWGWATWKRAWKSFDPNAVGWEKLDTDQKLRKRFNLGGAYDFATMLSRQMHGIGDSWAIRWYWSVFKRKGLVLFPPCSLVRNTGFDGSGTHGRGVLKSFSKAKQTLSSQDISFPDKVSVDEARLEQVSDALWKQNGGWKSKIVDSIRRLMMQ